MPLTKMLKYNVKTWAIMALQNFHSFTVLNNLHSFIIPCYIYRTWFAISIDYSLCSLAFSMFPLVSVNFYQHYPLLIYSYFQISLLLTAAVLFLLKLPGLSNVLSMVFLIESHIFRFQSLHLSGNGATFIVRTI